MFFIFGWGHLTKKQFDSGIERVCSQCHNHVHMILVNVKKWFTFFFLPLIPYGSEYFLACPTCGNAVKLNKMQFDEIRHGANYGSGGETIFGVPGPGGSDLGTSQTSSAVVVCPNCSSQVELNEFELKAKRYTCPACNTTVHWEQGKSFFS